MAYGCLHRGVSSLGTPFRFVRPFVFAKVVRETWAPCRCSFLFLASDRRLVAKHVRSIWAKQVEPAIVLIFWIELKRVVGGRGSPLHKVSGPLDLG